jgi:hypothetical protein
MVPQFLFADQLFATLLSVQGLPQAVVRFILLKSWVDAQSHGHRCCVSSFLLYFHHRMALMDARSHYYQCVSGFKLSLC